MIVGVVGEVAGAVAVAAAAAAAADDRANRTEAAVPQRLPRVPCRRRAPSTHRDSSNKRCYHILSKRTILMRT